MAAWAELLKEYDRRSASESMKWLTHEEIKSLEKISQYRGDRGVIFYASAFLERPSAPVQALMLTNQEVNGLMAVIHEMNCSKGLTLVLHSPGGEIDAVEPVVDYLRSKFSYIEVIVPTFAESVHLKIDRNCI